MALLKAQRLGDDARVPSCCHSCLMCCHDCVGPATGGSPTVYVNGKPWVREGDPGVHSSCCGDNTWVAETGSPTVYANGIPVMRGTDVTTHCGGTGKVVEETCSSNVLAG